MRVQEMMPKLVSYITESDFISNLLPAVVNSQKLRYPYTRPKFLYFSNEEISLSADQSTRPVLCPKDPSKMLLYAGYAKVINAGKTVQNEDQASAKLLSLKQRGYDAEEAYDLANHRDVDRSVMDRAEATLSAIFDGHAGSGAAVMAANCLHDDQIAEEKQLWRIRGGCTYRSTLFSWQSDCRALLVTSSETQKLTQFNPETERKRLQFLAYKNPDLISNSFTRYEYSRFLTRHDLRRKVFYRDWFMDEWAAKTVRESDLKMPLSNEHGEKLRLLNTVGVSRGFGDYHLFTADNKIPVKPFLSPVPKVKVLDLHKLHSLYDKDLLVLASDGLWDALNNDDVAVIVKTALSNSDSADYLKYTMVAQKLAIAARGNPVEPYRWQMSNGSCASTDDITIFIIPLKYALASARDL